MLRCRPARARWSKRPPGRAHRRRAEDLGRVATRLPERVEQRGAAFEPDQRIVGARPGSRGKIVGRQLAQALRIDAQRVVRSAENAPAANMSKLATARPSERAEGRAAAASR